MALGIAKVRAMNGSSVSLNPSVKLGFVSGLLNTITGGLRSDPENSAASSLGTFISCSNETPGIVTFVIPAPNRIPPCGDFNGSRTASMLMLKWMLEPDEIESVTGILEAGR
jgi:hypothetical protein